MNSNLKFLFSTKCEFESENCVYLLTLTIFRCLEGWRWAHLPYTPMIDVHYFIAMILQAMDMVNAYLPIHDQKLSITEHLPQCQCQMNLCLMSATMCTGCNLAVYTEPSIKLM